MSQNITATVQLEPLDGLSENAIDVCCDNSGQLKVIKVFLLSLLVVFSYCVSRVRTEEHKHLQH